MQIKELAWDDINVEHISKHGLIPRDVEQAISNRLHHFRQRGRMIVLGQTDGARYLTVVLEEKDHGSWRIITARDSNESERRSLRRRLEGKRRGRRV